MKALTRMISTRITRPGLAILMMTAPLVTLAQTKPQPTTYPNKAIRIVSPSGAGSGNDILARLIGQSLSASLAQPVVVDNRPGASGALGAEFAAKSSPDGYTFSWALMAT